MALIVVGLRCVSLARP